MFDSVIVIVFEALLIVLFVKVSVVALPTKVSLDVGNVKVPVLEIVEITGDVNVLFVNVCEPVNVATVLSISKVISLVPTVDVIPVPPETIKVSPKEIESSVELSSLIVIVEFANLAFVTLPSVILAVVTASVAN